MKPLVLTNARIITPTENFMGSLVIENNLITDIVKGKNYGEGEDLHGLWLSPGCIDIHSDYLEREIHPRPGASFPLPMAFHFMDQRAAACGLTTVFSAISFSDNEHSERTFQNAVERAEAIDALNNHSLVNHFLHARLDPNTKASLEYLDTMKAISSLKMVVYNDSVPGQRQYRFEDLVVKRAKAKGIPLEESRRILAEQVEKLQKINMRPEIYSAFDGAIPLGSHDDTTVEHVEEAAMFGSTLCEMPTTIEAARKAREMGMAICMGAPNYVRGGSHCGNLSCHEAMEENLVDILCSDYHFPTMLTAAVKMMQDGVFPSDAINYLSLNPAKYLKLDHEKGSIDVGKVADLICFEKKPNFAKVLKVWVGGNQKYSIEGMGANGKEKKKIASFI